jgi:hypothetical protein
MIAINTIKSFNTMFNAFTYQTKHDDLFCASFESIPLMATNVEPLSNPPVSTQKPSLIFFVFFNCCKSGKTTFIFTKQAKHADN